MSETSLNNSDLFTEEFLKINHDAIYVELKEKGYFVFPKAINSNVIKNIHRDATKYKINLNNNEITGVYAENQYYFTNLLSVSKAFYDFVTSNIVFDICKKILGDQFRLKALRYYETYGKHQMQWHTDNKTSCGFAHIPGIIFIFYISDVDDGQFQYIEGSHLWSGEKGYSDYSDDFIQKKYKDKVKDFKLASGSLIIYNTYGIHRAKPVSNKKFIRKSVFFQVDNEIENSEPIILNSNFITKVDSDLKMFLGFGKKSNYEIYPKTSINNLSFNKITRIYLNYIIFRFLKNLKMILPKEIKIILKKYLKKGVK
jgi:hypothetical protein